MKWLRLYRAKKKILKYSRKIVDKLLENDTKEVIVYCANSFSKILIPMLEKNNIKVLAIIDYYANLKDINFLGYSVKRPMYLRKIEKKSTLIIASFRHLESIYAGIEYFTDQLENKYLKVIDYECNFKLYPPQRKESLTIQISDKISHDSKEYKSFFCDKLLNINNFHKSFLNLRGYRRKDVEDQRSITIPLDPFDILEFEKADVLSSGGLIFDNRLKLESFTFFHTKEDFDMWYHESMDARRLSSLKQIFFNALLNIYFFRIRNKIKICFCHPPSHFGFSHFSAEAFPRLYAAVLKLRNSKIEDFYVICPPRKSSSYESYIGPMLNSIGIGEDRRIYPDSIPWVPKNYIMRFKNVFLPTQVCYNGKYLKPCFENLKKYFFDENFLWNHERIYLSRKFATYRKVANEEEFAEYIESKYGFKRVFIEDYSYKDRVNIVNRAKIIIVQEGSPPGNAMFLDVGSKVIILRTRDVQEMWTFFLSSIGMEHLPIVCDLDNAIENYHEYIIGTWAYSDIRVDLDYFDEKMNNYCIEKK